MENTQSCYVLAKCNCGEQQLLIIEPIGEDKRAKQTARDCSGKCEICHEEIKVTIVEQRVN